MADSGGGLGKVREASRQENRSTRRQFEHAVNQVSLFSLRSSSDASCARMSAGHTVRRMVQCLFFSPTMDDDVDAGRAYV